MEPDLSTPPGGQDGHRIVQIVIRLVALLLFLIIGFLTVPKLAPRFAGIYQRAAARQSVWRKAAGRAELPEEEIVRGNDMLLIGAVVVGGGLVLFGLGYVTLRR